MEPPKRTYGQDGSISGGDAPPAKHKRTRTGCTTCRKRRVKCDETSPLCANCKRLGLECHWTDGRASPSTAAPAGDLPIASTSSGSGTSPTFNAASGEPPKLRHTDPCAYCKAKRLRCRPDQVARGTCENCHRLGILCKQVTTKRTRSSSAAVEHLPASAPTKAEARLLLRDYFHGPHQHIFLSFIHEGSFMQQFENDSIPQDLILIVVSMAIRLGRGTPATDDDRPDRWINDVKSRVINDAMSSFSTYLLSCLVLLFYYELNNGKTQSAWMLCAMSCRMAFGLKLHLVLPETSSLPPATTLEIRRRLLWSCFALEGIFFTEDDDWKPQLPHDRILIPLPASERAFALGLNGPATLLDGPPTDTTPQDVSLAATVIRLVSMRRRIMIWVQCLEDLLRRRRRFVQPHPDDQHLLPWQPRSEYHLLEEELDEVVRSMPPELASSNLSSFARAGRLVQFVSLHCLIHSCQCLLRRFMIWTPFSPLLEFHHMMQGDDNPNEPFKDFPADAVPVDFRDRCRLTRLAHAYNMCAIISQASGNEVSFDPFVGFTCFQGAFILSRERRRDESETQMGLTDQGCANAIEAAIACLERISVYSKPCRNMLDRLRNIFIFQETQPASQPPTFEPATNPNFVAFGIIPPPTLDGTAHASAQVAEAVPEAAGQARDLPVALLETESPNAYSTEGMPHLNQQDLNLLKAWDVGDFEGPPAWLLGAPDIALPL